MAKIRGVEVGLVIHTEEELIRLSYPEVYKQQQDLKNGALLTNPEIMEPVIPSPPIVPQFEPHEMPPASRPAKH